MMFVRVYDFLSWFLIQRKSIVLRFAYEKNTTIFLQINLLNFLQSCFILLTNFNNKGVLNWLIKM